MLIKCPECNLQVSDKAYSCPHCGYPMKTEKPFVPSKAKHRRLPNGFGQIAEIKNKNLRNRFRAMVTVGKTSEGKPICKLLKPKSYFATYNEAYQALVEYNKDPYDLDGVTTVQELYDKWSKEYFRKISVSCAKNYRAAWAYCTSIYGMPIREVRPRHLKACIEQGVIIKKGEETRASASTKAMMKTVFNLLFDYAIEYELTDKNSARAFSLPPDIMKEYERNKNDHIAFTEEEMQMLWDNVENFPYISFILYQCYSGWRPNEMCAITLNDVHLEEGYIVGGMKTDSGKSRKVPIHPRVRHIVEAEYKRAKEFKSNYLFNKIQGNAQYDGITYTTYRRYFVAIVTQLGLNPAHRPHDPRKTFVTMAKRYGMDEYALKKIVGHDIGDITEAIYTERDLEWYASEMQKIK